MKQLWLKRRGSYSTSQWSSGKTTEIFIYPENGSYSDRRFGFRISSATVNENESLFSDLSGFYRYLMPLTNKMTLIHNEHIVKKLSVLQSAEFDGGIRTRSIGHCQDFNLMVNQQQDWIGKLDVITQATILRCNNFFTGFLTLDDRIILESKKENFSVVLNQGDFLMAYSDSNFDICVKSDSLQFKVIRVNVTKRHPV